MESLLVEFSRHNSVFVRWALARNPNIPPQAQVPLVDDKDLRVRLSLANNPNASFKSRLLLAMDEDTEIQEAIFKRSSTIFKIQVVFFMWLKKVKP